MTFVFEDGAHVDIKAKQTHSFMSHDLNWAIQAHGRLINVLYESSTTLGQSIGSSRLAKALRTPVGKCTSFLSRMMCLLRRIAGKEGSRAHVSVIER